MTFELNMTADASKTKKDLKQSSSPATNPMMTPPYPMMLTPRSFAVVSHQVFLPYVQAPVRFAKNVSKEKEIPVPEPCPKVRYVPAYACPSIPSAYLKSAEIVARSFLSQQLGIPFAMRINPEAVCLNQGYVSALTPPPSYVIKDADIVSKSELNPLSRPYTPPSRLKQCACEGKSDCDDDINCRNCHLGELSSSESNSVYDLTSGDSRVSTPDSCCSSKWSMESEVNSSDVDRGAEGECDDGKSENDELDESTKEDSREENSIWSSTDLFDGFDMTSGDPSKEELSTELASIVDFLCLHLDSHEWRAVARDLGVNDIIIQSVEYDFYENFRDQMKFVFSVWAKSQKSKPYHDIYPMTEKALSEIGRQDLIKLLNANHTE